MTEELPGWITSTAIPLVATRGTPTGLYFTLYQLKLLGVPAGQIYWWWRWLYKLCLRSGPFESPGLITSIKMSTIQNVETIVHLHWLRQKYPHLALNDLLAPTHSVEYAETTAVQCGYRRLGTTYVAASECEDEIGNLMAYFEQGNPQRVAEHDDLLARFSFDRRTVMKQSFGIEFLVVPQ
jgi:hypothetical protein